MPGPQKRSSLRQDDIFDAVVDLETSLFQQGFDDGFISGVRLGKDEGREVGLKSGFELGEEIGFYRGCVTIWKIALERDSTLFSARAQRSIDHFDEQLRAYPLTSPEDERLQDLLASLRVRFKAIMAMLSIRLDYSGYPKASSAGEISF
ncbi:hypothetical protein O6H91_02G136700 [Diphasiastrum complanatum]|uniref:Uncharacterized protein n=1 Tax=Diphasiastrum complanatum TaxID=34168 RepID=A0ACC2ELB3_DIPCM|nr:hypothetical protein O6H91_02G136700 [Diphasiastrum complanatum]